jgi:hypothetical protein
VDSTVRARSYLIGQKQFLACSVALLNQPTFMPIFGEYNNLLTKGIIRDIETEAASGISE